jgi:hypothetical protein
MKLVKIFILVIAITCIFSLKNLKNDKISSDKTAKNTETVKDKTVKGKRVNDKYVSGPVGNGPVEADVKAGDGGSGNFIAETGVEAEERVAGTVTPDPAVKENLPKPLSVRQIVSLPDEKNRADKANTKIYGQGVMSDPPRRIELEKVTFVKEISPVGRAALELSESGDVEYQKLLNAGFESPKSISQIINPSNTNVGRPASMNYNWNPIDPSESNLWQNVEFNMYNNRLLDTTRYITPAKFERNMFGNIIVHAPSDSKQMITTPAKTVMTTRSSLLSTDEAEQLATENEIDNLIAGEKTPDQM